LLYIMTNRVGSRRRQLKIPQQDLAGIVGISRQALSAIEAGRSTPSVDVAMRIASALTLPVEALFGRDDAWTIRTEKDSGPSTSDRRVVARVGGRWVAQSLGEREHDVAADGLAAKDGRSIRLYQPQGSACGNVFVMGCAPALGTLIDHLNSGRPNVEAGPHRFVWLPRPSKEGFEALRRGRTHVAGMHLTDDDGAEANTAFIQEHARSRDFTLVTLGHWEIGLVVARGNPKSIRRAADVAGRGVRLVDRERGSSPRRVLETRMRAEGARLPREVATVRGHRDVARLIAAGAADVGPAVRDVAVSFRLGFVPFGEERFDLAVPTDALAMPEVRRLLETLTSARMRAELQALAYDARETGKCRAVPGVSVPST
jgi:putative molybdopterin biosynthesis protein